jgi:hypothetical protein
MITLAECSTSDPAPRPPTTPRDDELHIAEVNFADLTQADDRNLRDLDEAVDRRSSDGWRRRDPDPAIVAEAEDIIESGREFDDAAVLAVWQHPSGRVAVQLTASEVGDSRITVTVLFVPD